MKKVLYTMVVIGLSVVIFVGCKCSSDVLATYDEKSITRGQFKQWLSDKQFAVEAILKSKKQQKDKLEMMAIEDIALIEAKKANFLSDEKYKFLEELAFESLILKRLYDKEVKEKADFNEKAYHIKQILLRVRDFKIENNKKVNLQKEELEKAYAEAEKKAYDIIQRLKEGQKFEDLAGMYSDDFSKKKGGDIGYVVKEMLPSEVGTVLESAHVGIIDKPIRSPHGVYVIELVDKVELNKKNLKKFIKDERQAKNIENILLRKAAQQYIERLMQAPDVHFDETKCKSKKVDDVIFSVGDEKFTVSDLEKRLAYYRSKQSIPIKKDVTDDKRVEMSKNAFKVALLKREAMKSNIHKEKDFELELEKRVNTIIAKEYMDYVSERGINITPEEIKNEYNRYKDTRFTTYKNINGKQIKEIIPFEKVKDQIEVMIHRKKKSENLAKWKRDMLHISKFTIYEDELEGK